MSTKHRDPRPFQIAALTGLLLYGFAYLELDVRWPVALAILVTALLCQALAGRLVGLRGFDPKSALISSLSLCLLLRTASPWLAAVIAAITIGSKFVLRARGKHIFNPTNFGLAVGLLLFDGVWVSPGQWGSVAFFGFLLACAGTLVVHRSRRSDVTWAFLAAWSGLLVLRAMWLGDPLAIVRHQLQNGALLIFAFFMISDPKTTPNRRAGRILWATAVAGLAGWIQFGLFRPNAFLSALVLGSMAVPVVDRLLPARRYRWGGISPDISAVSDPHAELSTAETTNVTEVTHDPLRNPPSPALLAHRHRRLGTAGLGLLWLLRRQGRH